MRSLLAVTAVSCILSVQSIYTGINSTATSIDLNADGTIKKTWSIEEFPWHVSISHERHLCGGAIVSDNWIVTSASCVTTHDYNNMTIRSGSVSWNTGGNVHIPYAVVPHPQYSAVLGVKSWCNLALVQVEPGFGLNNTEDKTRDKIELFDESQSTLAPEAWLNTTGMGETEISPSYHLLMVQLQIVHKEYCRLKYESIGDIQDDQICLSFSGDIGKGPCYGDGGSPLTYKRQLVGLFAWQNGCASREYPAVYTELRLHREWIRSHASNEAPYIYVPDGFTDETE